MLTFVTKEPMGVKSSYFEIAPDSIASAMATIRKTIAAKESELVRKALHMFTGTDDPKVWSEQINLVIHAVDNEHYYMCGEKPVLVMMPVEPVTRGYSIEQRTVIELSIRYAAFDREGNRVEL